MLTHKATVTANATYCTDQEKLVPTFSASVTGKGVRIMGTISANTPNMTVVYGYLLNVALTDAQKKALLQAHGYTIPWS
jgi:predicted regulator of Ras-like GTPase activity (Roadblock/LC7/MglB family)